MYTAVLYCVVDADYGGVEFLTRVVVPTPPANTGDVTSDIVSTAPCTVRHYVPTITYPFV